VDDFVFFCDFAPQVADAGMIVPLKRRKIMAWSDVDGFKQAGEPYCSCMLSLTHSRASLVAFS